MNDNWLISDNYDGRIAFAIGIVTSLCFGYNYFANNVMLVYFASALLFIGVSFLSIEKATILLFIICPNTYFIMIGSSAICGYLAIVLLVRLLWINPRIKSKVFIPVVVFIIYVIMQAVMLDIYIRIVPFIKSLVFVLLFSLLYDCYSDRAKDLTNRICEAYIFGALMSCILSIALYIIFGRRVISLSVFDRFTGLTKDPNYFSATLAFAFSLALTICLKKMKFSIIDIVSILILVVTGLLTLSRGFLLTIVVVGIFCIISVLKTRGSKKIGLVLGIIIGSLSLILILRSMQSVWNSFVARIHDDTYSGGSGRTDYWLLYLQRIGSSIIGIVFGNGPEKLLVDSGYVRDVSHNTFLDLLYEFGILGSLIYSTIYINFGNQLKSINNHFRIEIGYFLPLMAIVVSYSLLTALTGDNFVLTVLLSVSVIIIMPNYELP